MEEEKSTGTETPGAGGTEEKTSEARFESQLRDIGSKLDQFAEKASKASGEMKVKYDEQMVELKKGMDQAGTKLKEFQTTGGAAWGELRVGLETAFKALKESVQNAMVKLKEEEDKQKPE
jgi:hypothetical protein